MSDTKREPQPLVSDDEVDAAFYETASRFRFAERIESLVRRRLAERIRAAAGKSTGDYGLREREVLHIVLED